MIKEFVKLYESGQRFVVFDVESVGENIVEIGAMEAGQNYAKGYKTFQKILRFCPSSWRKYYRELQIHKIPAKEIENGEEPAIVLQEFLDFIEESILICHTGYDIRAMQKNLEKHQLLEALELPCWQEYIDSCKLARRVCPHLKSVSLTALTKYFKIENPQAHRALADAYTTKRIVAKLLQAHYTAVAK